jgi:hypothetical protein
VLGERRLRFRHLGLAFVFRGLRFWCLAFDGICISEVFLVLGASGLSNLIAAAGVGFGRAQFEI